MYGLGKLENKVLLRLARISLIDENYGLISHMAQIAPLLTPLKHMTNSMLVFFLII